MSVLHENEQAVLQQISGLQEQYRCTREVLQAGKGMGMTSSVPLHVQWEEEEAGRPLSLLAEQISQLERSLVPNEAELHVLPRLALVALAGRCARRFLPRAMQCVDAALLGHAVTLMEKLAAAQTGAPGLIRATAARLRDERAKIPVKEIPVMLGMPMFEYPSGYDAAEGIEVALDAAELLAQGEKQKGVGRLVTLCQRFTHPPPSPVGSDYRLLVRLANSDHWNDATPVPSWVWAVYSSFELEVPADGRSILEVSSLISTNLIKYFRQHPEELYQIDPRKFEELVAELFLGFGYSVELTAQTRDGGRDVIAVSHRPANLRFLIECKRYAAERTVGIAPVQRLLGVVSAENSTKGILVTTARRFSRPATELMAKRKWILEGREFEKLVEWLALYEQLKGKP